VRAPPGGGFGGQHRVRDARELETSGDRLLSRIIADPRARWCRASIASRSRAFSAPQNATLDELRIESHFPLDEATTRACERFADASGETP
jgi:hypothetical protein